MLRVCPRNVEFTKLRKNNEYERRSTFVYLLITPIQKFRAFGRAEPGFRAFGPKTARLDPAAQGMWSSAAKARGSGAKLRRPGANEFAGARQSRSGGAKRRSGGTAARRRIRSRRAGGAERRFPEPERRCETSPELQGTNVRSQGPNARNTGGASAKRSEFRVTLFWAGVHTFGPYSLWLRSNVWNKINDKTSVTRGSIRTFLNVIL